MRNNCKNCGKEITNENLTYCSDICIFESVKKSKKSGNPKNPHDYSE